MLLKLEGYFSLLKIQKTGSKKMVLDPIRKKYVTLSPEELVRQLFLQYLIQYCPVSHISVERSYSKANHRPDIVVYDLYLKPFIIVELKEPGVKLKVETLMQVGRYHKVLDAKYLFLSNGIETILIEIDKANQSAKILDNLPDLSDVYPT